MVMATVKKGKPELRKKGERTCLFLTDSSSGVIMSDNQTEASSMREGATVNPYSSMLVSKNDCPYSYMGHILFSNFNLILFFYLVVVHI